MVPSSRASKAARSRSNTRAVPSNTSVSKPADFTTAPPGANEPRRIVTPPVLWMGLSISRRILPSGSGGLMSARFSATVFPVTVRQSDRKSTRMKSSHVAISYVVFCLKKKKIEVGGGVSEVTQTEIERGRGRDKGREQVDAKCDVEQSSRTV